MPRRVTAAALLLAGCAACSSSSAGSTSASPTPASTGTPTPSAAATRSTTPTGSPTASPAATPLTPSAPPVVATPTSTPTTATAKPVLVLEGDGLGFLVGTSSIRHLPFGSTTATQIETALSNAIGAGTSTPTAACGQGPRSSYAVSEFSVLLDGTRFVGWTNRGPRGFAPSTADGVGLGITLAKLRSLKPAVTVSSGSLGPEFFVGKDQVNGFLSGTSSTSKVTSVYAGETCFAR